MYGENVIAIKILI